MILSVASALAGMVSGSHGGRAYRPPGDRGHRRLHGRGKSYSALRKQGWQHATVNHSEREYVRRTAHTNTIEGFWSLAKPGVTGSHHWTFRKWLQGYLNEYVWRYNHRDDNGPDLFALVVVRSAFPVSR